MTSLPAPSPAAGAMDASFVLGSVGFTQLTVFNRAGILSPADVHTAARLCWIAGESSEDVALAVALAVRGPRVGHVRVDLSTVRDSAVVAGDDEVGLDISALPWPDPEPWIAGVAASPLVAAEPASDDAPMPLHLDGPHLYLDRFWRDELLVADDLLSRGGAAPATPDEGLLRLFPGKDSAEQARAAAVALAGRLTVIAGGPGTGKTTTVARLLARLFEEAEHADRRPPLVALAAPTGKAAARMQEAVRSVAGGIETTPGVARRLGSITGSTLHRLLGRRPGDGERFRHHRGHRLPHDVVVVDESSMVSLALMARLLEAVRPDAKLILVGDPEQLVSVEAGAVLADIVGPDPGEGGPLAGSICLLRHNHRFGGAIADLAEAIRAGDEDTALSLLRASEGVTPQTSDTTAVGASDPRASHVSDSMTSGASDSTTPGASDTTTRWVELDAREVVAGDTSEVEAAAVGWAVALREAAHRDPVAAIAALGQSRVLCGHRRGEAGVTVWNQLIESWLGTALGEAPPRGWYPGRPVMVTANDYSLSLFNGDGGVVVTSGSDPTPRVAFDAGDGRARFVSPYRLSAVETVYAMTVHKSQGSEFDHITFVLPPATSRLLTRELLYTAVTRARRSVLIVGTEEALRIAISRPIGRASGLDERMRRRSAAI